MKGGFLGPCVLSGKSILTNSEALARAEKTEDANLADLKLAALVILRPDAGEAANQAQQKSPK